ncbi:phosphatidate cytidylyltransferase [Candidatus Sumerlaeota bacterium]|nr:phosphatidate cytidylyltransferase [Candidatus Sumerlaeota bacterium]
MLALRLLTTAVFFALFILGMLIPEFGRVLFPVFIVFATLTGSWEYFTMCRSRGLHPPRVFGLIFSMAVLLVAGENLFELFPVLLSIAVILTALLQMNRAGHENFTAEIGAAVFGYVYVSLPMAFVLVILAQAEIALRSVVFMLIVSWSSDTGAYAIGRICGKHKLSPRLSPGKTIEGALGGVSLSLLAAALLSLFAPGMNVVFPLSHALLLGLLFSVVGQAGDLVESALKRDAGIKDSGIIIPGMGGMLDVIDSLLVCAPILFIYLILTWKDLVW